MAIKRTGTQFHPLVLNDINVEAIFNKCLSTDNTTMYVNAIMYPKSYGNQEDFLSILFDRDVLLANRKHILYLYGQLLHLHQNLNSIHDPNVYLYGISSEIGKGDESDMINYLGEHWTENKGVFRQFALLGVAAATITPFTKNGNSIFCRGVSPTFSPKDPNFPVWWQEHRYKWEKEK
ncbi:MAG: hypothetical protein K1W34_15465 [Lachnospiraceae bacterium]